MDNQNEAEKIGGWLILFGIGIVLSPIQLLITSVISFFPLFTDGSWAALTTITSEFYHPLTKDGEYDKLIWAVGILISFSMYFVGAIAYFFVVKKSRPNSSE